jgi:hypothetical protein
MVISDFGCETGYPNVLHGFLSPSRHMVQQYKWAATNFFQILINSLANHLIIQRYTV